MQRLAPAAALVALLAVGLAVGPLAAPAASLTTASPKDGCSYLKTAEVSKIVGAPVTKGKRPSGPADSRACGYQVGAASEQRTINVWVQGTSQAKTVYSRARSVFRVQGGSEEVPGLGRKAFYAPGVTSVYVLKDAKTVLWVQYLWLKSPDPAAVQDQMIELAKIVVRRA